MTDEEYIIHPSTARKVDNALYIVGAICEFLMGRARKNALTFSRCYTHHFVVSPIIENEHRCLLIYKLVGNLKFAEH